MKNCRRILSLSLCVILAVGTLLPSVVTAAPERADQRGGEYRALPSEDAIASMSKFDGRDYGIVTPVKDQGSTNLCWAYSSVAASETSILRSGINPSATPENLNLNPQAAAYRISNRASDPLGNTDGEYIAGDFTAATGNPSKIATLFSLWWGPVSGKSAAVDPFENSEYRLESAVNIPENKDNPELRIETIKRAIAKYGAVTFQYNNASNIYYYNPKNETGSQSYPHACTIIGWDDTIPADSFAPGGASRNGGWLIKNSYSSLPDGYPYFYISYDNTSSYTYAFSYSLREKYDRNYCYDGAINDFPLRNDRVVANVYRAAGSEAEGKTEVLKAVNIGISGNSYTVEVEVFTGLSDPFGSANPPTDGGKSAAKKTQSFDFGGYVTVSLDTPVELSKGEWFSVIVRITDGNAKIRLGEKNGRNLSYAGTSGGFTKIGNYVGRIKALTSVIDALPDEDDTEYNFTNLVVLAKFSGEEEFANDVYQGATVAQIIDNTYNRAGYSVRDYFGAISNGKLKMRTLFLLDNGGSVTLSRPRGYYAEKDDFNPDGYEAGYENLRIAELREDWADAVNDAIAAGNLPTDISGKVYDAGELDKNGDGKIDCITVIYKPTVQNISVGWSSPLWDYHYYSPFVGISTDGGELISSEYVQLTLSYMTADGRSALYKGADALPIASLGKICHETLHVFGLKDLYRSDLSSEVYFMSAMGKPLSPAVQFISVKEREALGFLSGDDILTLSCDGSYSLDVSSPHSSGTVGYKLELPERGKTLYLEYRRFEGSANRYDTKSKELYSCATGELIRGQTLKSGLVCYLAKSGVRFPSNLNGTSEYVVVSGGIYSTKSDAAIAPGESINITDEISITVTEMSEGALRFEISGIGDVTPPHTHKLERTEGIPATCVADGVRAHYRCTECGAYFDAEDTTTPVEYSSLIIPSKDGAHDLRLVTAAAPSCTGDGHVEHYECRLCGKLFADSAAEREISADDVKVPAAHSLGELVPRKNATCVADGVRAHYRCTECEAYFDAEDTTTPVEYSSLIIPSKDGAHDLRLVTAAAPSCTGDGHVEHYECRLCGKLFADSAAEREISADDVKIPAAHTLGELVPRKNATCVADGVRAHYRCTECGAYFDADDTTTPVEYSSLIIPSKDGAHDLRLVTAAAPSCTGDGHVEHYECRLCGKLFADSAAEREISADDVRFLGDGNRDGRISVKDIVIAIRAAIGQTMDNIDLDALDVNRDGSVDVKDIVILIRHSTGYKQSYLIGYPMSSVPGTKPR